MYTFDKLKAKLSHIVILDNFYRILCSEIYGR